MPTKTELEEEVIRLTQERDSAIAEVTRLRTLIQEDTATQTILDKKILVLQESKDEIQSRIQQLTNISLRENERTALREHYRKHIKQLENRINEISKLQGDNK